VICDTLHDHARRIIAGEQLTSEATVLLRALSSAEKTAPELYRGFGERETAWDVLHQYRVGLEFPISLASFSSQRTWADEFAWLARDNGCETEVVFVLREGSKSVRIDVLAPDNIHWREREWYTGGRFAVRAARMTSKRVVEVTIEQTGVYDV
jgi:hypothetical protein